MIFCRNQGLWHHQFYKLLNGSTPTNIEFLQCRRRPFGPSSLHRQQSHPGLIPIAPRIYPANPPDTKGQFSMANQPNPYSFVRKPEHPEETHADTGRICRLQLPRPKLNPGPWRCEAAVLTIEPSCHPRWAIKQFGPVINPCRSTSDKSV